MKKYIYIILGLFILTGCSSMKTLKEDYVRGKDVEETDFSKAMKKLKYDYLMAEEPVMDKKRVKEVQYMAQEKLHQSPYKDDFRLLEPVIDDSVRMPEAFPYVFVHFYPYENKSKFANTTYLVVISRFYNRIVYADLFTPPQGDSFYRYHRIVKGITE